MGPVGPVSPVGPVGPVAPVGPVGPVVPIGPVSPVGPVGPVAPVGPVGPVSPVGPVGPVAPIGPVSPVGPVAPVGPIGPVAPVGPVAPIGPVGPVAPIGPVGPVAPAAPVGPVAPTGPVGPVGPVGPEETRSSCTTTSVAFTGTLTGKKTVAVLALIRDAVTGAASTSNIPTPETSPVLIGEFPSKKSPCEEEREKTAPLLEAEDWVATHHWTTYLPASLNVMTPVSALYVMLPAEKTMLSNMTFAPVATDPAARRSICKAISISISLSVGMPCSVRFALWSPRARPKHAAKAWP